MALSSVFFVALVLALRCACSESLRSQRSGGLADGCPNGVCFRRGHRLAASDPEVLPPGVENVGSEPPDDSETGCGFRAAEGEPPVAVSALRKVAEKGCRSEARLGGKRGQPIRETGEPWSLRALVVNGAGI